MSEREGSRESTREGLDLQQIIVAAIGALLAGVLYLALSSFLQVGPPWLLLVIEVVLLAPDAISLLLLGRKLPFRMARSLTLTLLCVLAVALATAVVLFVQNLLRFQSTLGLLHQAGLLWLLNILVFATLYWEIDGDGPVRRRLRGHEAADFQFPQQQSGNPTKWEPGYVDYVFLAFCFATALSPADTPPLSRRAKLLMMAEAIISASILLVLIGRSINIGQ